MAGSSKAKTKNLNSPKSKNQQSSFNLDQIEKIMLTDSQKNYHQMIRENTITFCFGPAGTSKTFTSCYAALKLLAQREIDTILLVKPLVEVGNRGLGYLPGDVKEKVDPYMDSYYGNILKIIGKGNQYLLDSMIQQEQIIVKPLQLMRGDTYDRTFMLLDEAQNADFKQLMNFLTRIGKDSKMAIFGDITQYDLHESRVDLVDIMEIVRGVEGIGFFEFGNDDVVRNKIVKDIVEKYEKWKKNQTSKTR